MISANVVHKARVVARIQHHPPQPCGPVNRDGLDNRAINLQSRSRRLGARC